MKTFKDLVFYPYEVDSIIEKINPAYANYLRTLKHSSVEFLNGYALSICFGKIHPIGKIGYSVGIFKDKERLHNTEYDRQCVTKQDIDKIMLDVQQLAKGRKVEK